MFVSFQWITGSIEYDLIWWECFDAMVNLNLDVYKFISVSIPMFYSLTVLYTLIKVDQFVNYSSQRKGSGIYYWRRRQRDSNNCQ